MKILKQERPEAIEFTLNGNWKELANRMVLKESEAIPKQEIKDWTVNKDGNGKNGLFNVKVKEPVFTMVSQEHITASNLVLGFLATDTIEKNNIYPTSVSCWAGDSLDSLSLLGNL